MKFTKFQESLLSLNFLQKNVDFAMPAVIMEKGTQGVFNNCFVKGNPLNTTIGFAIKDADCLIDTCKIVSHSKGGILVDGERKQKVIISNSKFFDNGVSHIEITGLKNKCLIENNSL